MTFANDICLNYLMKDRITNFISGNKIYFQGSSSLLSASENIFKIIKVHAFPEVVIGEAFVVKLTITIVREVIAIMDGIHDVHIDHFTSSVFIL